MNYRIIVFIVLIAFCFILASCSTAQIQNENVVLGDANSNKVWIYLCGLTDNWNSWQEVKNRAILRCVANAQKIQILEVKPQNRCLAFDNKLCWPHDTDDQMQNTYKQIIAQVAGENIAGFIGFSNGGFFLNKLAQKISLQQCPIIFIGSAGTVSSSQIENDIYLIIGVNDFYHYKAAMSCYEHVKQFGKLNARLIKHSGGHIIPESVLQDLIHRIKNNTAF